MSEHAVRVAVDRLLAQPSPDAAVDVLRAADAGPDSARRDALARLDTYLRQTPDSYQRSVADCIIALRRA